MSTTGIGPAAGLGAEPAGAASAPDVAAVLAEQNPWALELARLASLAARVEPELLRALRLELLPGADVSAEADLWWSWLVDVRSAGTIRLAAAALEGLRAALAPAAVDGAYRVIQRVHRRAPRPTRLEEALTFHGLARAETARAERILAGIVDTMLGDPTQKESIAAWALGALPRLPARLRKTGAFWTLLFAANAQGRGTADVPASGVDADVLAAAFAELPPDIAGTGGVEILARQKETTLWLAAGARGATSGLVVPDVDPLLVEVQAGARRELVRVSRTGWQSVEVGTDAVRITTVDGRIYALAAPASPAPAEPGGERPSAPIDRRAVCRVIAKKGKRSVAGRASWWRLVWS